MAKPKLSKDCRDKFKEAKKYILNRDVESARSQLLEVELGSSYPLFHRLMAACAYIDKEYDLATSHIEQAIALDPDKQVLIADAIRIYRSQGDDIRARGLLERFNLDKAEASSELMRIAQAYKSYQRYEDSAITTSLSSSLESISKVSSLQVEFLATANLTQVSSSWDNFFNNSGVQFAFSAIADLTKLSSS